MQESQESQVQSLGREDPLERAWQPTPVWQRSLAGYSPQGQKESIVSLHDGSDLARMHSCISKVLTHWHLALFSSVQSLSHVRLLVIPWIAAHQASLSITNSRSSLRLTSIKSVMPSSHLILCRPLLLLPPVPPSIRVFSNESTLRMRKSRKV